MCIGLSASNSEYPLLARQSGMQRARPPILVATRPIEPTDTPECCCGGLLSAFVDAASWAAIVGPITTLFGGLGGYWLASRNDEARDRRASAREVSARRAALADRLEENRHIFQRDTLLELQDELQRLARATTRILLQDEKTVKEDGQLHLLPEGLSDEEFQINTAVRRLWVRVLDRELRDAVEGFVNICTQAGGPAPGTDKNELLAQLQQRQAQVVESYRVMNDLLGDRLRQELDRKPLAGVSLKGTEGYEHQPYWQLGSRQSGSVRAGPASLIGLGWTGSRGVELQPKLQPWRWPWLRFFAASASRWGTGGEVPASGGGESTEV